MGAEEDLVAANAKIKDLEADVEKWKGLSRKHEDTSKENFAELEKLKASQLSADDKKAAADKAAADKLAGFEKQLAEERSARMRAEVAAAKGLTPAQAKRLAGTTQEELEADADELLESFPSADKGDNTSDTGNKTRPATRPKTNVTGGGDPNEQVAEEMDPTKLSADLPRF